MARDVSRLIDIWPGRAKSSGQAAKKVLDRRIAAAVFHERRASAQTSPIAQGSEAHADYACRRNIFAAVQCPPKFVACISR
jgi:hypothetical protein